MFHGPQERHAAQKAQEQRRITQGGQATTHVGNKEDEEHNDVRLVAAPHVCAQHRANQKHGGACGAHPACQERANGQHNHVVARGAGNGTRHVNVARDNEQAQEQNDKGNVVKNN